MHHRKHKSEDRRTIGIWVNPPSTPLPLRNDPVRFAAGTPEGPSSNSWRLWVHGEDVYLACRDNFREIKVSLHASGSWRVGYTKQFAKARPDVIPEGQDRAWQKWEPELNEENPAVIAFQLVFPSQALYLGPTDRKGWTSKVVFVEPPLDPKNMTVVSVAVALGQNPVRFSGDALNAVFAMLSVSDVKTVQLVASHAPIGRVLDVVKDTLRRASPTLEGIKSDLKGGIFLVQGMRRNNIPWLTAVPFVRRKDKADHRS